MRGLEHGPWCAKHTNKGESRVGAEVEPSSCTNHLSQHEKEERERKKRERAKGKKRKEGKDKDRSLTRALNRLHQSEKKAHVCFGGSRFWCWIKMWLEIAWSSSLGNPARVYKWINWSRPCWARGSGKAPVMTMWQCERKPLSRTLGGEAENGERTWDTFVGPWYISSNGLVSFQAWSQEIPGQVQFREWWVCRRNHHQEGLHMVQVQWGVCHQRWDGCRHIGCGGWIGYGWREVDWR